MGKSQYLEEKSIRISGIEVNCKITGQGMPFLLLHGWGRGTDAYIELQNKIANAGFQVFAPDFPGFGKSAPPSAAWGVEEYTRFVLDFANAFGLQNFVLFGHSFGGQVAANFAIQHFERVRKLILCAAAIVRKKPGFMKRILWLCAKTGNMFFSIWPFCIFQNIAGKALYRLLGTSDWKYSQGIMKKVRERVVRQDLSSLVSRIAVPTLIVWGDQDKATPVQEAYFLKEKIKNSVLEIIPGAGHRLFIEKPEDFFDIVLKFITKA